MSNVGTALHLFVHSLVHSFIRSHTNPLLSLCLVEAQSDEDSTVQSGQCCGRGSPGAEGTRRRPPGKLGEVDVAAGGGEAPEFTCRSHVTGPCPMVAGGGGQRAGLVGRPNIPCHQGWCHQANFCPCFSVTKSGLDTAAPIPNCWPSGNTHRLMDEEGWPLPSRGPVGVQLRWRSCWRGGSVERDTPGTICPWPQEGMAWA